MAAFGLSHSSNESDDCQPQDSISSSLDGSTGGRDLSDNEATLSPASSYNKAMAQLSIKNQSGVSSESELFSKCIPNIFHSGKKNTSAVFVSLRRLCKPYNRKHYSTHIAVYTFRYSTTVFAAHIITTLRLFP